MSNYPKRKGFEPKLNTDGSTNPNYVDALNVDPKIKDQEWTCMSFLNPKKILVQKDEFMFEHFLKGWALEKSMGTFSNFLGFLSYKYHIDMSKLTEDFEEFTKNEEKKIKEISVKDHYEIFMNRNGKELEKRFAIKHKFQTSVHGVKNRGNFATEEEAKLHADVLRDQDPAHDIFIGPVGNWLCNDPEAYKSGETKYMEDELNQLANEKRKSEEIAKKNFDERVKQIKRNAIEENIKKAEKSGNILTQTIDEEGNLLGVNNTQENAIRTAAAETTTSSSSADVTSKDVYKTLFEGEDIVTSKDTDHGFSNLSIIKNNTNNNTDEK